MQNRKPRVLITRKIPEIGIHLLKPYFELDIHQQPGAIPRNQLLDKIREADALLCLLTEQVDRELLDSAPRLKIVSNFAVGYNNIDVEYATRKGIVVTNTPGVLTDATADLTWALLLAVTRRVVEGDRIVRSGKFTGWDPLFLLGADLVGRTLGIVGAGRIGTAVARRARGWNMNILYCDKQNRPEIEQESGARRVELKELLEASDFVSIHVPLTPETFHLFSTNEFKRMKPTAYLINTARGPIVDETALVRALESGEIAGAALDVFENEPEVTPQLLKMDNVVLTPHIGSATIDTRNKMAEMASMNILRFFQGQQPLSVVNPEVLEKIKLEKLI